MEAAGLLRQMRQMLFEVACRQIVSWRNDLGVYLDLYFNINASEPSDPEFVADLASAIGKTGLDRKHLVLELERDILLKQIDEDGARALGELRETGIRLAIDDLTNGEVFQGIARLGITIAKLDHRLVQGAGRPGEPRETTLSIVRACSRLGIEVLAEGVEQQTQIEPLLDAGCRTGQGFLFGRPMHDEAFARTLAGRVVAPPAPILGTYQPGDR
jgi:EAL domain-containing protein (putative c-di-GMP-specific phosphodiesterase class I)